MIKIIRLLSHIRKYIFAYNYKKVLVKKIYVFEIKNLPIKIERSECNINIQKPSVNVTQLLKMIIF